LTSWEVELTSEKELVDRELRNYKYLKKKKQQKVPVKRVNYSRVSPPILLIKEPSNYCLSI
jgi:hypothetical protein